MGEITWKREARTEDALRAAMTSLGHTNIVWDVARGHFRGTCEHGCTGILMDGVHSYGTGLDTCGEADRAK